MDTLKIENYYLKNINKLNSDRRFHFLSRIFLWRKEQEFKVLLEEEKSEFIGENNLEVENNFKKVFEDRDAYSEKIVNQIDRRKIYVKKFPLLGAANRILFQCLMAKTIYNEDYRSVALKIFNKKDLLKLKEELEVDKKGVAILSTHAVNFLYLAEWFFSDDGNFNINPEYFLEIANDFYEIEKKEDLMLKIYLLTHCIIGESRFYSKKIKKNRDAYEQMLKILERIIDENYLQISLDNKLEFIVCSKIYGYDSRIREKIFDEVNNSLSKEGDFIIDMHNEKRNSGKDDFASSEHRNVLCIMANK